MEYGKSVDNTENRNWFLIDSKLGSMNDYTKACRTHWSVGAEYKRSVESLIGWSIKRAKVKGDLQATEKPVEVFIEWHERTRKRDCDNIQSAQKFILDALQHFKIIKNDSRKYIKQIHHKVVDDKKDFVIVELREVNEK